MPLSDKFISLATAFRNKYATTDKLSIDQMIKGMGNLETKNLIKSDQVPNEVSANQMIPLQKLTPEWANQNLKGQYVVFSFDMDVTDFSKDSSRRVGFEYAFSHTNGVVDYIGAWIAANNITNGHFHVTSTGYINPEEITSIDEGYLYFQINAKAKVYNFKIAVNPMGGVVKPLLSALTPMKVGCAA